jgi:nicotinate-nucleotide adenylyltransferase
MGKTKRIGIYAGTFNPVHTGHVAFALQAIKSAKLDEVIFLPERVPRYKSTVEHYGHRVAMLTRATKPYKKMSVLELVDRNFSTMRTLPKLQKLFPGAQLVLLAGSDTAIAMPHWTHLSQLLTSCELVVGVRSHHDEDGVVEAISRWPAVPQKLVVLTSAVPDVSSRKVRQAIRTNQPAKGLLASVQRYAKQQWLYVSLARIPENV